MIRGVVVALFAALLLAGPAHADRPSPKKAIWGPVSVDGASAFPVYHELGVGIFETYLRWNDVATRRPANPTDPLDPAYAWPAEIDQAIQEARRYGIRVLLMIHGSPGWANGGRTQEWVPTRAADLAAFATAAARRYPAVRHWMIWGEPTRQPNFMPLVPETVNAPLIGAQKRAPRKYARMLDAAYGALKGVRRSNVVIGGNSFTAGDVSPQNWIRGMRLRTGRRPRMDLYGHNPFSIRRPDLSQPRGYPGTGYADVNDLDLLRRWLRRQGYRDGRGRVPRIFVSEYTLPTDHPSHEFNFWVTREVQANWLADAMRIARSTPWIYSFGWISLYDEAPRPAGDESNRGLIDNAGVRKRAFFVYRDG